MRGLPRRIMIRLAQPIMIGCVADANRGAPPPAASRSRYSLLPAATPWVRAAARRRPFRPTRVAGTQGFVIGDNPRLSVQNVVARERRRIAAQHVPRGTGREGARSEAEQRPAPGGGAPCP